MTRWRIDWTARPGRRSVLALVFFAAAIYACQDSVITGPSGGGGPPPTTSVPPDIGPPRVDAPFEWSTYAGFSSFALGKPGDTESHVLSVYAAHMSAGWNTGRICSEAEFWTGDKPYLPQKPRDIERLRWLLEIIATIPGAQVLLIGDCTLKRQIPLAGTFHWAEKVAAVAATFQNVAIETHNEPMNCRGRTDWGGSAAYCPSESEIRKHIKMYRRAGVEEVTVDQGIDRSDADHRFDYFSLGAWPADFHPIRTKSHVSNEPWDPNRNFLRSLIDRNGFILLSETVALGPGLSGDCSGLRTCDLDRLNRFIRACADAGDCGFTFHSEEGLAGEIPPVIPRAR